MYIPYAVGEKATGTRKGGGGVLSGPLHTSESSSLSPPGTGRHIDKEQSVAPVGGGEWGGDNRKSFNENYCRECMEQELS